VLVFELDLPGFDKADVRIKVVDGALVIQGKRKRAADTEGSYFKLRERKFGSFQREFVLPEGTDPSQIKAKFEAGVLMVTLPLAGKPRTQNEIKID
jgi:HSP20 family protein